jgi:hypothetical protein
MSISQLLLNAEQKDESNGTLLVKNDKMSLNRGCADTCLFLCLISGRTTFDTYPV